MAGYSEQFISHYSSMHYIISPVVYTKKEESSDKIKFVVVEASNNSSRSKHVQFVYLTLLW